MRDDVFRREKDRLLAPVALRHFQSVDPNALSFLALFVGLLSVAAIMADAYLVGLLLWILNRFVDGLDGLVARTFDRQTDFGGYLDLLVDFVIYLTIPIAFVATEPIPANLWASIALISAFVINLLSWSALSALIEKRNRHSAARVTSIEMPTGLIEGAETIVFYALFFLLPEAVAILFGLMAALVLFTAGQRIRWAYQNL